MLLQVRFLVESLDAELAGKRPLAGVRPQVDFERVGRAVPLPAQITAEFFPLGARVLTPLGIPFAPDRFAPHLGTKQSFRGRALQVERQVGEVMLREGLGARFKRTFAVGRTGGYVVSAKHLVVAVLKFDCDVLGGV